MLNDAFILQRRMSSYVKSKASSLISSYIYIRAELPVLLPLTDQICAAQSSGLHLILSQLAKLQKVLCKPELGLAFAVCFFCLPLSSVCLLLLLLMYYTDILSSWILWPELREWCMVVLLLFHAVPFCTRSILYYNCLFSNHTMSMPFLMRLSALIFMVIYKHLLIFHFLRLK